MDQIYSQVKAAWHTDRLDDFRKGIRPRPIHVQLILSDLCNQDCVPAGTLIDCPEGKRPIETLAVGDWVIGPDGKSVQITRYGSLFADKLYEVTIGDKTIQATAEHPFLTSEGWKETRLLEVGKQVVVRMRVQETGGSRQSVPTRPQQQIALPKLSTSKYENTNQTASSPRAKAAFMFMWVWWISQSTQTLFRKVLERLYLWTPNYWKACTFQSASPSDSTTDAETQSNEGYRNSSTRIPHQEISRIADQYRAEIFSVLQEGQVADFVSRNWEIVGQPPQSRFPGDWAEESNRDNIEGDLQWRPDTEAECSGIRQTISTTLCEERLAMPCGVLPRRLSTSSPNGTLTNTPQLLLEGIKLERGLELQTIDSVQLIYRRIVVYNFACPPIEAYIANDVVLHNCGFCAYRSSSGLSSEIFVGDSVLAKIGTNNPKRQIPLGKAIEIVEDCSEVGVKAMQFTGGGEPTVHPEHLRIIQRAQDLGMDTGLVTNGLKLNPNSPAMQNLDWIRVSVDAGTPEMYAQVRRVPELHWNKVWSNIQSLAASSFAGLLGVGFVVTKENYSGIALAAQMAKRSGAANMRVGAVFSIAGSKFYKHHIPDIVDTITAAKAEVDGDGFELIDLFSRRVADLDAGSPKDSFCSYQYLTVYIGGDLNVYRCCNTAYTLAGKVGDLKEGRRFRALSILKYEPFDATKCRFCQFIGQNESIRALTQKPTHENFV